MLVLLFFVVVLNTIIVGTQEYEGKSNVSFTS